jgi:hypothetical protein
VVRAQRGERQAIRIVVKARRGGFIAVRQQPRSVPTEQVLGKQAGIESSLVGRNPRRAENGGGRQRPGR